MPVSRYRIYMSEKTKSLNTPMEDSNKAEERQRKSQVHHLRVRGREEG